MPNITVSRNCFALLSQSFPCYRFSQRIHFVLLIVPHRHLLARIRVAVFAQVRASIILPYVFAQDAAAELSLAFVAVVPLLEGVLRLAQPDGAGGNRLRAKQGVFHRLYLQTLFFVIVQRVLDVTADVPVFQLVEMPEQRLRVFRPKHDKAAFLIRHEAPHAVEGIGSGGIADLQPMEEPVGIERGNVGAAAGRDNFRHLHPNPFTIFLR